MTFVFIFLSTCEYIIIYKRKKIQKSDEANKNCETEFRFKRQREFFFCFLGVRVVCRPSAKKEKPMYLSQKKDHRSTSLGSLTCFRFSILHLVIIKHVSPTEVGSLSEEHSCSCSTCPRQLAHGARWDLPHVKEFM